MSWFKPVAVDVEKAVVGPIAWGYEENEEKHGAVDARPIEEVGQKEERHDKSVTAVNAWPVSPDLDRTHNGDAFVGMKRSGSQLMFVLANLYIFSMSANAFTSVSRTWSIGDFWSNWWICKALQTPWWLLWGVGRQTEGHGSSFLTPHLQLIEVERLSPTCSGRPSYHGLVCVCLPTESPPTLAALPVTTSVANTSVSLIQLYSLSVIFVQKVSVFWLQYRAMSLNNPFNGRLPNRFQLLDVRKSQARREIGVDRTAQSNSLVYQCSTCGPCQAIN